MCPADPQLSQFIQRVAGNFVEILSQRGISATLRELLSNRRPRQPASAAAMRHDVRDRFTMNGQRDTFTGAHRVDHAMRLVAQDSYTHLHVRHRSTR